MDYPNIRLLNFRDVGGLKTRDGRTVKNGNIFRSGQPGMNLDKDTVNGIEALGLNTIFDLRDPNTLAGRIDYPFNNINNVSLSVLDSIEKKYRDGEFDFGAIDVGLWDYSNPTLKDFRHKYHEYLKLYKEIPFSKDFSKVFEALDRHEKILLHCQGGKDRTGIITFVILKALGVNEKEIIDDYLVSNVYRKEKNEWRISDAYKKSGKRYCAYYMSKLLIVEKKYYKLSIDAINRHYQSFENYLFTHFGITKNRLQNWKDYYLE